MLYHADRVKQASVASTKYRVGDVVTLTSAPDFGVIKDIVITQQDECILLLGEMESVAQPHFHAYEVSLLATSTVCKLTDLADHHPLTLHCNFCTLSPSQQFVCLKYHIM